MKQIFLTLSATLMLTGCNGLFNGKADTAASDSDSIVSVAVSLRKALKKARLTAPRHRVSAFTTSRISTTSAHCRQVPRRQTACSTMCFMSMWKSNPAKTTL